MVPARLSLVRLRLPARPAGRQKLCSPLHASASLKSAGQADYVTEYSGMMQMQTYAQAEQVVIRAKQQQQQQQADTPSL